MIFLEHQSSPLQDIMYLLGKILYPKGGKKKPSVMSSIESEHKESEWDLLADLAFMLVSYEVVGDNQAAIRYSYC